MLFILGLGAITIASGVVSVNPGQQAKLFHDAARVENVQEIISAITASMLDNQGLFKCSAGSLPNSADIEYTARASPHTYNLAPCVIPKYLSAMPFDPSVGYWHSAQDYVTGYRFGYDASTGRVTVLAPYAELPPVIVITR